jgi:small-conductance mechanosensitive channel
MDMTQPSRLVSPTRPSWVGRIAGGLLCVLLSIFLVVSAPSVSAQGAGVLALSDEESQEWQATARRAELTLEAGRASDRALERLRAQLVDWREVFMDAQGSHAQRIDNLQSQLAVLGPAPDDGSESAEISARRQDLTERLAELRAPVLAAETAASRASGLIAEVDTELRNRQADALVAIGPSPLNPVDWAEGLAELKNAVVFPLQEVRANLGNELRLFQFRQNLLVIIPLSLFGALLLMRGRGWAGGLVSRLRERLHVESGARAVASTEVLTFVVSLGKVLVPWVGLVLLVQALLLTSMFGLRGEALIAQVPLWGAILLVSVWLCDKLFPDPPAPAVFEVDPDKRPALRRVGGGLATAVVLAQIGATFEALSVLDEVAGVLLAFPLMVISSLALMRLARLMRAVIAPGLAAVDEEEAAPLRLRAAALLVRGAMIIAFLAPLLAAIGYRNAAEALIYPAVYTVGLLAALFATQHLATMVYALFSTRDDPAEALVPALVGVALAVLALPILALIWGMRVTDLTELWSQFMTGIALGDTRISPRDFIAFAMLFGIGYVVTRMVQGALKTSVLPKTRLDQGGQTAVASGVGYLGITISALVAITGAGLDLSSIAIVAGALSVGIGFGLQTIVSNFVSGIILLVERPISEGDWIEVGGQMGYVRDISVRATRIETFDRTDVIIPNADLVSGTVTNYTRGNTVGRLIVSVGVAYGTDTRKVEKILQEIAEAHPMVLANPAPSVLLQGFGADALDFEIRAILRDVNWLLSVRSEMNHTIAERFAAEGIEIPFAQRDIWLRNPEALQHTPAAQPATPASTVEERKDERED